MKFTQQWPALFASRAVSLLSAKNIDFEKIDVTLSTAKRQAMRIRTNGQTSVPQIFINDDHIGGCDDLFRLIRQAISTNFSQWHPRALCYASPFNIVLAMMPQNIAPYPTINREGSPASLVALPECATYLAASRSNYFKGPNGTMSYSQKWLGNVAREFGIWFAGSLIMRRRDNNQLVNRSLLFGPDGEVVADYDKIHMFDADVGDGKATGICQLCCWPVASDRLSTMCPVV